MGDDKKTIAGFLGVINSILKQNNTKVDMILTKERCLLHSKNPEYDIEFISIDLSDLQKEDCVYIQIFIILKDRTMEGYSFAKVKDNELTLEFVNLDSIYPPIERSNNSDLEYKKIEDYMKNFVPILINTLNLYLKS